MPAVAIAYVRFVDRFNYYIGRFMMYGIFVLMAVLAVHDKKAADRQFDPFFERIKEAAIDERNFVKKAVNWALRQIGKRNLALNKKAITLAEEIQQNESKAARWVAKDALRELRSEKVRKRLSGRVNR